jgi:hypothetical protein
MRILKSMKGFTKAVTLRETEAVAQTASAPLTQYVEIRQNRSGRWLISSKIQKSSGRPCVKTVQRPWN